MSSLGLPHWLMIGGFILVLAGFVGLMLTGSTEVEADLAAPTGDIDEPEPAAVEETEGYESRAEPASRKRQLQGRSTPLTTLAGGPESSRE